MPFWKVYHPVGAFTAEDKKMLANRITELYDNIPIPRFYVVFIFEEVAQDSCFVGGEPHNRFFRFKIDQMARTTTGPVIREWWMKTLDAVIAPFVKDRGNDCEITFDDTPFDLWWSDAGASHPIRWE